MHVCVQRKEKGCTFARCLPRTSAQMIVFVASDSCSEFVSSHCIPVHLETTPKALFSSLLIQGLIQTDKRRELEEKSKVSLAL